MTVPDWLAAHPANKLAEALLSKMKVPVTDTTPALLQLALEWLRRAPKGALPWPEYQTELRERAEELAGDDPIWAASLLVDDFQTLDDEAEKLPAGPLRHRVLKNHLARLLPALRRAPTASAVGKLLAENLYSSLCVAHPDFGRQSA